MPYQTPITDRAASDITNKTAKAFLNVADWVRIYGNSKMTHALVDFFMEHGVDFTTLDAPTITTIPTAAEVNQLLANIETLRTGSNLPAITGFVEIKDDWTAGSAADSPDYEDVNSWEQVIEIIHSRMEFVIDYRMYCGVPTAGQTRFYQHRWRLYPDWVQPSASPARRARTGVAISGTGLTRTNYFRRYD